VEESLRLHTIAIELLLINAGYVNKYQRRFFIEKVITFKFHKRFRSYGGTNFRRELNIAKTLSVRSLVIQIVFQFLYIDSLSLLCQHLPVCY
jgi:hypothetical protein